MTADRLRIGLIAPPWLAVPPTGYGGTETIIDTLARSLVARGHEVVLFATGDSTCPVERDWVIAEAPGVNVGGMAVEVHHVVNAYERLAHVDVIHDHSIVGPLYGQFVAPRPLVVTNHNPYAPPFSSALLALGGRVPVIAISRHQAESAAPVPIAAVIHHGLDPCEFPTGRGDGGYAVFLGRISPDKGADRAARAAQKAGLRLLIAGRVQAPEERAYFDDAIRPLLGPDVEYVGEVGRTAKLALLEAAAALVNPIAWDEPFGMVMIEALACGTPVVALAAGAAPEIVTDGVTGFLANDEAGLVEGLSRIGEIDRAACRAAVEGHFNASRMADEHLAVYRAAVARAGGR